MDKLDKIFEMQKRLNDDIIEKRKLYGITREEWIQKHALAMLSEIAEVLDEVNFKWWKNPKPIDTEALKYELTDVLHFLVSMFLAAGVSADEVTEAYLKKNKENFDRQAGLSDKAGYKAEE